MYFITTIIGNYEVPTIYVCICQVYTVRVKFIIIYCTRIDFFNMNSGLPHSHNKDAGII